MVTTKDINGAKIALTKEDQHHLYNVMRRQDNDEIIVCDYQTKIKYLCKIKNKEIIINRQLKINNELKYRLKLVVSLVKNDKLELIMQKASELGVQQLVIVPTRYSNVKLDSAKFEKKLARWHKIVKEACEQSLRNTLMEITFVDSIKDIGNDDYQKIVAYEKNDNKLTLNDLTYHRNTLVFIGPEGGFSPEEIAFLEARGFTNVTLGQRILRCETAAIVSCGIIGNLMV